MQLWTEADLDEALADPEVKATVITPGGRVGNDSAFSRSRSSNWVAREGGLPKYVRIVARGIMKRGKTESEAIRLAIGVLKNWASGKGNVSAKVRAAAAKAIAQWEAMRGHAHARSAGKVWDDHADRRTKTEAGAGMNNYKEVSVKGLTVDSEAEGIVTTIVSVTGVVDNVKDNILPGAYDKTLATRKPKGVWGHDWNVPISKTLDAKELRPGDPELPKMQRNGEPWPKNAGGLKIQTQFNLDTPQGKTAFSNVKFYGDDQEWSIGYQVPTGGSTMDTKTGVREINTIDLYEYSPVLFGAMPLAVTTGVKDMQELFEVKTAFATLERSGVDMEFKKTYSAEEREKLAGKGHAMDDGSFPIADTEDLHNAIQSVGRAKDPDAAKAHIKKRAKELDATDALPDHWKIDRPRDGETKQRVDSEPYADPGADYEDDTDDTAGSGEDETVEVSADDLQTILDLIQRLEDFVHMVIGDGDDADTEEGPDAVTDDDMTIKSDDIETIENKAGPITDLVDELGEEVKGSIGNFEDLADLAEQFDDEVRAGDIDDAMDTAENFVDSMKVAIEETTDQQASDALTNLAEEFAEYLQNAGIDTSSMTGESSADSSDGGEKSDTFMIDMKQLELFENMSH